MLRMIKYVIFIHCAFYMYQCVWGVRQTAGDACKVTGGAAGKLRKLKMVYFNSL